MSSHSVNKMASTNRVWSHNTNYTGAAGIHSEDGPMSLAKNNLTHQRSSAVMTVEEEILRKKMKSLNVSRKSLETSMLSYSKKMKDISEKRNQAVKSSPPLKPPSPSEDSIYSNIAHSKPLTGHNSQPRLKHERNGSVPSLKYQMEKGSNQSRENILSAVKSYPDLKGRVSADSGVGTDTDNYCSDNESTTKSKLNRSQNGDQHESTSLYSLKFVGRKQDITHNQRKLFRIADSRDEAAVLDNEDPVNEEEEEEKGDETKSDLDESLTISPFPENNSYRDSEVLSSRLDSISEYDNNNNNNNNIEDSYRTRILEPISSSPIRLIEHKSSTKQKRKKPQVFTKPKAAYSPSIRAMRLRRRHRNPTKKNSKSLRHIFRYSEAVETALRSLNNSPEGPPHSPELPGLDLNELLQEVIQRPYDHDILLSDEPELPKVHRLYRERSFSEPIAKPGSFCSTLEQVREDNDSELRSVLRKNTAQYPAERKSVQFFLPDIFLHANACNSRPTALR